MSSKKKEKRSTKDQQKKKRFLLYMTIFFSIIYFLWRYFFTLPMSHGTISIIVGTLLLICEGVTVVETFTHFINNTNVKFPEMPKISNEQYPTVDVLICTHNESTNLLYKTLTGCNYMAYPDKEKVKLHLCDDQDRPEVKELADYFGVEYHGFSDNEFAKAGNLNHALKECTHELTAVFDADMIPTRNFLLEIVPYFRLSEVIKDNDGWRKRTSEDPPYQEEPLAYVQTRQSFYNLDTFQRNLYLENSISNEQDYFYREVNPSRLHSKSAAFAGSNVVFDRSALEAVGGFATHSITEDLATSIELEGKGYMGIALDKELAHGLCPEDTVSFMKQRQRWSRGSAQCIINRRFFSSGLSLKSKFNYFTAYLYWWTFFRRFVFVICPILFGVFGIAIADTSLLSWCIMWIPYFIFYNYSMKIMSDNTINTILSSIQDTIQFPFMIAPIVMGTLQIPEKQFEVTSKEPIHGRNSTFRFGWLFIVLTILDVFSIINCLRLILVHQHEGAVIVLFWALYNLLPLINAIVYYYGREIKPEEELLAIQIPITCERFGENVNGKTVGMNESKLVIEMEDEHFDDFLLDEDLLTIHFSENQYSFKEIGRLQKDSDTGRYTLPIDLSAIENEKKQNYYQILYDRPHTLTRVTRLNYLLDIQILLSAFMNRKSKKKCDDAEEMGTA